MIVVAQELVRLKDRHLHFRQLGRVFGHAIKVGELVALEQQALPLTVPYAKRDQGGIDQGDDILTQFEVAAHGGAGQLVIVRIRFLSTMRCGRV